MDIFLVILFVVIIVILLLAAFEYRIRQPDIALLYEHVGQIKFRKGTFYPRHFSLPLKRTIHPIQLDMEMTAAGNLGMNVKLAGSVAPSLDHIEALIRTGGWRSDAVARAAEEAQILLQGLVKEYTEQFEIQSLTSKGILDYLNEQASHIEEKIGVELVSLVVQSLDPTDPEIITALQQQEQARLLEHTEKLCHQARAAAAKAKTQTDEEIAIMSHNLGLKKAELKMEMIKKEAEQADRQLEHELNRNRLRLEFEKEEVDVLKSSPELLMLTPQAARLAEASQNLKNARTVVSFTPQELAQGSEIMSFFQELIQKALDT